jgi:hypothetical protein
VTLAEDAQARSSTAATWILADLAALAFAIREIG